jgi:hypothetical protein
MNILINKSWLDSRQKRYNINLPKANFYNDWLYVFDENTASQLHKVLGHSFLQMAQFDWNVDSFEFNDHMTAFQIFLKAVKIHKVEMSFDDVLRIADENGWIDYYELDNTASLGTVKLRIVNIYDKSKLNDRQISVFEYLTAWLKLEQMEQVANRYHAEQILNEQQQKEAA